MRCRRCCSAARLEAAPAVAPVAVDAADAPASAGELAPAWPAAVWEAARSTGETIGPPADGDDGAEGATAAPETGAVGAEATAGGATIDGRRSDPYAGSGPAGTTGPPATGAAGVDHEPPVITAGATGTPPPVVGASVGEVTAASTGVLAAVNDSPPAMGMDGATGGTSGGEACGGGADPVPIACIAPEDNDCAPAPAG